MKALLANIRALGTVRLAALGGVAALTLGLLAALALRATAHAPMAPLFNGLAARDTAAMADALDKARIPHSESEDGSSLSVPRDMAAEARLALARASLPAGGSVGYELFDRGDGFTTSQFQQTIDETRAMEGELERSILLMRGVAGVRVHLVLPRHEPFSDQEQPAQASVLLSMQGAGRLDREEVNALLNLVAAAVPGLKPRDIAIVDNRGEVLARAGVAAGDGAGTGDTLSDAKAAAEARLEDAVEQMLAPTLGAGHVRAEAAVEMDFSQVRETDEKYDPDSQVARSTERSTEDSRSVDKQEAVSVDNNLPNPPNPEAAGGTSDKRTDETNNYEINKTTTETVRTAPRIRRITLAVLVDGVTVPGKDGKPAWQPRSDAEIGRIAALAKAAIGFDARRGDTVEVVSMRFTGADALPPPAPLLARLAAGADFGQVAQALLLGIVALVLGLRVLRPAVLKLAESIAPPALASPGMTPQAPGQALLTDETMVDVANVDGKVRAAAIRAVAGLVDQHTEEALVILRGWMAQEQA